MESSLSVASSSSNYSSAGCDYVSPMDDMSSSNSNHATSSAYFFYGRSGNAVCIDQGKEQSNLLLNQADLVDLSFTGFDDPLTGCAWEPFLMAMGGESVSEGCYEDMYMKDDGLFDASLEYGAGEEVLLGEAELLLALVTRATCPVPSGVTSADDLSSSQQSVSDFDQQTYSATSGQLNLQQVDVCSSSSTDSTFTNPTSPASVGNCEEKRDKASKYFWQYNVQRKGPKGLLSANPQPDPFGPHTVDPYHLKTKADPVFSTEILANCADWKGVRVKHNGKARQGDGNDLTANPTKLVRIGDELDMLNESIYSLDEDLRNARKKDTARKVKNKLASRVCRLKRKAQHEANKIMLSGLEEQHKELLKVLRLSREAVVGRTKQLLAGHCPVDSLFSSLKAFQEQNLRSFARGRAAEFIQEQLGVAMQQGLRSRPLRTTHRRRQRA